MSKRLLEIANNDLPSVQAKYEGLRREVDLLESKKESLEKEIFGLHTTLVQYRTSYREESDSTRHSASRQTRTERISKRIRE